MCGFLNQKQASIHDVLCCRCRRRRCHRVSFVAKKVSTLPAASAAAGGNGGGCSLSIEVF